MEDDARQPAKMLKEFCVLMTLIDRQPTDLASRPMQAVRSHGVLTLWRLARRYRGLSDTPEQFLEVAAAEFGAGSGASGMPAVQLTSGFFAS